MYDTLTTVPVRVMEAAWRGGNSARINNPEHMPCPGCGAHLEVTPFVREMFRQYRKNFLCPHCP